MWGEGHQSFDEPVAQVGIALSRIDRTRQGLPCGQGVQSTVPAVGVPDQRKARPSPDPLAPSGEPFGRADCCDTFHCPHPGVLQSIFPVPRGKRFSGTVEIWFQPDGPGAPRRIDAMPVTIPKR